MLSPVLPESVASCNVGAVAVVSNVNANALLLTLVPVEVVWRATTDFAPSLVNTKLLPLPVIQLLPPSVLYCQLAPLVKPETVTVPSLVMPSVALLPVSVDSVSVGAEGADGGSGGAGVLFVTALLVKLPAKFPATSCNSFAGVPLLAVYDTVTALSP